MRLLIPRFYIIALVISVPLLLSAISIGSKVTAQGNGVNVKCGDIFDGKFTKDYQINTYFINADAGSTISVNGSPVGNTLEFRLSILAPDGQDVSDLSAANRKKNGPSVTTKVLSADGVYSIVATGYSIGNFTLYVGCVLPDGTLINPGDRVQPTTQPGQATPMVVATSFSGNGFPGISPIDFSKAVKLKLSSDGIEDGTITPTGGEVFNFTLQAKANSGLNVTFKRTSGNMNLGLVVMSSAPDNKVICLETLVDASTVMSSVTIPADGQYIIGVFGINLDPPAAPVATDFEVQMQ